jgi:cytochrome c oxidase cbb3-type subunit 3
MPAWAQRLDPVTIKMLAAYVHSLGGGEKFAPITTLNVTPATQERSTAASSAATANAQP